MEQAASDYVLALRVLHTGSIIMTHAVDDNVANKDNPWNPRVSHPLHCSRCEDGADEWPCPECGARNPIRSDTITAPIMEKQTMFGFYW